MICRVCLLNVKKSAVLCAQCSLISHARCALSAPPTCDLRAQLLMYAQFAEKGSAMDGVGEQHRPKGPMSDVSYVEHPRTSIDAPQSSAQPASPSSPVHPPTAFKRANALKNSRNNLTEPPPLSSASTSSLPQNNRLQKSGLLHRKQTAKKDRPLSESSGSTRAGSSSLRSAATTNNSQGRKSVASATGTEPLTDVDEQSDDDSPSTRGRIPGGLDRSSRRHHKNKPSGGNCILQ
jgi:hypothetical protein